jgi:hypothetical protein
MLALLQAGWKVVGIEYSLIAVFGVSKMIRRAGFMLNISLRNVINLRSISGKFNLILDIGCFHSPTED